MRGYFLKILPNEHIPAAALKYDNITVSAFFFYCNIRFHPPSHNLPSAYLPHLLVAVFLKRWLSVALLLLYSLLLFFFGLRGQHELLRYLLLGDELGDRTWLPDPGGRRVEKGEERKT